MFILALVAAICVVGPAPVGPTVARADTATTDFTFKRVRAPSAGTRKRITVQIGTTATTTSPSAPRPARPQPRIAFGFFWQEVPATRSVPADERLAMALATLTAARAAGTPLFGRPETLADIAGDYGPALRDAAARHSVSEAFLMAVILVESGGRVRARSPKDAQGLMQLIPATARRMGVSDVWDPVQNIAGGARYLDYLLGLFGDDPLLALAGYNAGENAVIRNDGVPNYAETRDYVPKVLGAWMQARALCAVPPATVRARCDLGTVAATPGIPEPPGVAPPIRFSQPG